MIVSLSATILTSYKLSRSYELLVQTLIIIHYQLRNVRQREKKKLDWKLV